MALGLLPWIERRFLDADGNPLSGGFLYSYIAGTTTPQETYSEASGADGSQNPNPIELDADGRAPNDIFILPTGYKFLLEDADNVEQYTFDNVQDPGTIFASQFGAITAVGSKDVNSGYEVLATDWLVTIDATEATNPCVIQLPAAADYFNALTIKNYAAVTVSVTPDGSETIDSLAAVYALDAAASPNFPSVTLISDGVSAWTIVASHGITV